MLRNGEAAASREERAQRGRGENEVVKNELFIKMDCKNEAIKVHLMIMIIIYVWSYKLMTYIGSEER